MVEQYMFLYSSNSWPKKFLYLYLGKLGELDKLT